MNDFNRKVEDASARVNKSVAEATERIEKETAEFIAYLNDEVVPAVRQHSTKALRVAAEKMSKLADYLDEVKSPRRLSQRSSRSYSCSGLLAVLGLSGMRRKKAGQGHLRRPHRRSRSLRPRPFQHRSASVAAAGSAPPSAAQTSQERIVRTLPFPFPRDKAALRRNRQSQLVRSAVSQSPQLEWRNL